MRLSFTNVNVSVSVGSVGVVAGTTAARTTGVVADGGAYRNRATPATSTTITPIRAGAFRLRTSNAASSTNFRILMALSHSLGRGGLPLPVSVYAAALTTLTSEGRLPKAKDLSSLLTSKVAENVMVSLRSIPWPDGAVSHTFELFANFTSILRDEP